MWCATCAMEVEVEADDANGFSCCMQCGRVVEDMAFSSDVIFTKGGDGEGEMVGQIVGAGGEVRGLSRYSGGRLWAVGGDSHEASVSRGRYEIVALVEALRISPAGEATEAAHRLYRLALQRGFTRGRRVNMVAAVCLYIFCRLEHRPYMLIDFSDQLSVNVYALGAVFLQMLRLLRLDEHATFTKPIDPSLFMNRFVDRLRLPSHELKTKVSTTAVRLVQSMKRDWMLTGRRPNGICGAALFLASHIHGVEKTKKDVISIVHIGWATVEKRVLELAETRDASLTLRQLGERDKALEAQREQLLLECEQRATAAAVGSASAGGENAAGSAVAAARLDQGGEDDAATAPGMVAAVGVEVGAACAGPSHSGAGGPTGAAAAGGIAVVFADPNAVGRVCEHVRAGSLLLAHGMCRTCLEDYLRITLAVQEGAQDPPAYVRNLRRDIRKRVREKLAAERPLLALKGSGEVLALEGPAGGEDEEMDVHQRRHLENEEALREDFGAAEEEQDDQGDEREDDEDEEAAGAEAPDTSAWGKAGEVAASAEGSGARGSGDGDNNVDEQEEEDFDAALHSSELQSLAQALGGEAAAVASAPLQIRARAAAGPSSGTAGEREAGIAVPGPASQRPGVAPATPAAAAAAGEDADRPVGLAKRPRLEGFEEYAAAATNGAASVAAATHGATGAVMVTGSAGPIAASAPGGAITPATAEAGADADSDHLSDVEDDEISAYLATREEASVREQLWVELNREWIEKQEAKRAAEAAAEVPGKSGSERGKRKYVRKSKAALPAAEDAAGATRNLLEAKKLSNKINYGALADLFEGTSSGGRGGRSGSGGVVSPGLAPPAAAAAGGGGGGRRSTSSEYGSAGNGMASTGSEAGEGSTLRPPVASMLARRAAERARVLAADADRYTAALEEEEERRRGSVGGLGGSGGFLDSLTFVRGNGKSEAPGGRMRPQSLSLKALGR
ncbi:hypothetical protein Agub_g4153 [Astrephomene gubernaculifera]|uniref:Cyclin-like domain-containing protein n=1 Tax=Astrephomene gubernaculifera TaxID=47775 RepID=A0AAD3DJS5_9CHLO|nr:hypothetical protein Agub_g4153 [Astrephomene gubernaculifera]